MKKITITVLPYQRDLLVAAAERSGETVETMLKRLGLVYAHGLLGDNKPGMTTRD